MPISTDKNSAIERQRLEILINSQLATVGQQVPGGGLMGTLPFDPTNPPDDPGGPRIIAENYLDNTDFDFSVDTYLNNPQTGGDAALELYNWYRQRAIHLPDVSTTTGSPTITVPYPAFSSSYTYPLDFVLFGGTSSGGALIGTLTRVDSFTATMSVNAQKTTSKGYMIIGKFPSATPANLIKAAGHSTFPANEGSNNAIPIWDKTNGWIEFATNPPTEDRWDLASPLPVNLCRPGMTFFLRAIVKKKPGGQVDGPCRLYAGIWDDTASQSRFLESGNLGLTLTVVGTPGSTTYDYVVIAQMDDGRTLMSDIATTAVGPNPLTPSNYVRLTWNNASGILSFTIYRKNGIITKRVFTIRNGANSYNDYGTDENETLGDLPTASEQRPLAYGTTPEFMPQDYWQSALITLRVPATYDSSLTTGRQWVRIGVIGSFRSSRAMLIDRVMFSTSDGGWQRSARDLNRIPNANPSSLPSGSDQGDTGVGCFPAGTLIAACHQSSPPLKWSLVPVEKLERGMLVLTSRNRPAIIKHITCHKVRTVIRLTMAGRTVICSDTQPLITSRADKDGTPAADLKTGDKILLYAAKTDQIKEAEIEKVEHVHLAEPIDMYLPRLRGGVTFAALLGPEHDDDNWLSVIAHNRKPGDLPQLPEQQV